MSAAPPKRRFRIVHTDGVVSHVWAHKIDLWHDTVVFVEVDGVGGRDVVVAVLPNNNLLAVYRVDDDGEGAVQNVEGALADIVSNSAVTDVVAKMMALLPEAEVPSIKQRHDVRLTERFDQLLMELWLAWHAGKVS